MSDFDIYIRQADGPSEADAERQLDAAHEAARVRGFTLLPIHQEAEDILRDADMI
jgi:hypothetical protein